MTLLACIIAATAILYIAVMFHVSWLCSASLRRAVDDLRRSARAFFTSLQRPCIWSAPRRPKHKISHFKSVTVRR